jgi:hypothetical protein
LSEHVTPAACWAAVGGHGKLAASVAGFCPALSVVGHVAMSGGDPQGGPIVPDATVQLVEIDPSAWVDTRWLYDGGVHPTETAVLTGEPSATVGSLGASLHSRMVPIELCANPLPVTDTLCPPVTPVLGLTDIVGDAADATVAVPAMTSPAPNKIAAMKRLCLRILIPHPRTELGDLRRRHTRAGAPLSDIARSQSRSPPPDRRPRRWSPAVCRPTDQAILPGCIIDDAVGGENRKITHGSGR